MDENKAKKKKLDIANKNKPKGSESELESDKFPSENNPEPEYDEDDVILSWYDSDLNLVIDETDFATASPLHTGGFCFFQAGARATYGFKEGKVCFEVKVLNYCKLPSTADAHVNSHLLRVGWSPVQGSLALGGDINSFSFISTGRISTFGEISDYGRAIHKGDVIGAYLDIGKDKVTVSFALNGEDQGVAFKVPHKIKEPLFPHIVTKNISYECNFGDKSWFPLKEGFTFVRNVPLNKRVAGPKRPKSKSDCEVIMMCGLPKSGKTHWVNQQCKKNPGKYYVISTALLVDQVEFTDPDRKVQILRKSGVMGKILAMAMDRRRHYILDQNNLVRSEQVWKLGLFKGFERRIVSVVIPDEEYQKRIQKIDEREPGAQGWLLQVKAKFMLPTKFCPQLKGMAERIETVGLPEKKALQLVKSYNREAWVLGYMPHKNFVVPKYVVMKERFKDKKMPWKDRCMSDSRFSDYPPDRSPSPSSAQLGEDWPDMEPSWEHMEGSADWHFKSRIEMPETWDFPFKEEGPPPFLQGRVDECSRLQEKIGSSSPRPPRSRSMERKLTHEAGYFGGGVHTPPRSRLEEWEMRSGRLHENNSPQRRRLDVDPNQMSPPRKRNVPWEDHNMRSGRFGPPEEQSVGLRPSHEKNPPFPHDIRMEDRLHPLRGAPDMDVMPRGRMIDDFPQHELRMGGPTLKHEPPMGGPLPSQSGRDFSHESRDIRRSPLRRMENEPVHRQERFDGDLSFNRGRFDSVRMHPGPSEPDRLLNMEVRLVDGFPAREVAVRVGPLDGRLREGFSPPRGLPADERMLLESERNLSLPRERFARDLPPPHETRFKDDLPSERVKMKGNFLPRKEFMHQQRFVEFDARGKRIVGDHPHDIPGSQAQFSQHQMKRVGHPAMVNERLQDKFPNADSLLPHDRGMNADIANREGGGLHAFSAHERNINRREDRGGNFLEERMTRNFQTLGNRMDVGMSQAGDRVPDHGMPRNIIEDDLQGRRIGGNVRAGARHGDLSEFRGNFPLGGNVAGNFPLGSTMEHDSHERNIPLGGKHPDSFPPEDRMRMGRGDPPQSMRHTDIPLHDRLPGDHRLPGDLFSQGRSGGDLGERSGGGLPPYAMPHGDLSRERHGSDLRPHGRSDSDLLRGRSSGEHVPHGRSDFLPLGRSSGGDSGQMRGDFLTHGRSVDDFHGRRSDSDMLLHGRPGGDAPHRGKPDDDLGTHGRRPAGDLSLPPHKKPVGDVFPSGRPVGDFLPHSGRSSDLPVAGRGGGGGGGSGGGGGDGDFHRGRLPLQDKLLQQGRMGGDLPPDGRIDSQVGRPDFAQLEGRSASGDQWNRFLQGAEHSQNFGPPAKQVWSREQEFTNKGDFIGTKKDGGSDRPMKRTRWNSPSEVQIPSIKQEPGEPYAPSSSFHFTDGREGKLGGLVKVEDVWKSPGPSQPDKGAHARGPASGSPYKQGNEGRIPRDWPSPSRKQRRDSPSHGRPVPGGGNTSAERCGRDERHLSADRRPSEPLSPRETKGRRMSPFGRGFIDRQSPIRMGDDGRHSPVGRSGSRDGGDWKRPSRWSPDPGRNVTGARPPKNQGIGAGDPSMKKPIIMGPSVLYPDGEDAVPFSNMGSGWAPPHENFGQIGPAGVGSDSRVSGHGVGLNVNAPPFVPQGHAPPGHAPPGPQYPGIVHGVVPAAASGPWPRLGAQAVPGWPTKSPPISGGSQWERMPEEEPEELAPYEQPFNQAVWDGNEPDNLVIPDDGGQTVQRRDQNEALSQSSKQNLAPHNSSKTRGSVWQRVGGYVNDDKDVSGSRRPAEPPRFDRADRGPRRDGDGRSRDLDERNRSRRERDERDSRRSSPERRGRSDRKRPSPALEDRRRRKNSSERRCRSPLSKRTGRY